MEISSSEDEALLDKDSDHGDGMLELWVHWIFDFDDYLWDAEDEWEDEYGGFRDNRWIWASGNKFSWIVRKN